MTKEKKACGSWSSQITPELVAGKSLRLGLLQSENGFVYWTECRPNEKGRCVIMRKKASQSPQTPPEEMLPAPWSCRSRVHEYGGGDFFVSDDEIYFISAENQQIYLLAHNAEPRQLTFKDDYRFTDICMDRVRNRLIAVGEHHTDAAGDDTAHHPENNLIAIDLLEPAPTNVSILVKGHDFYASPTISPDGTRLSWLSWNLPGMPWESAALHVADLNTEGGFSRVLQVAGDGTNSVFQPQWHHDNSLYFIWDKTGWSNLYCWTDKTTTAEPEHMLDYPADFGQAQWVFGMKKYAILPDGTIGLTFQQDGQTSCGLFDPKTKKLTLIPTEESGLTGLEQVVATETGIAGLASNHQHPQAISSISFPSGEITVLRKGAACQIDASDIATGTAIRFKNSNSQDVYAIFYPPANAQYEGLEGSLPPCIFNAHGGPTAGAKRGLNLSIQYWTSRGFAFCDVDYSGSIGYGKDYRQRLDGQWGIADVDDMACAAQYLVDGQKVHKDQCIITGGSAGGLTVLLALANTDIFAAGSSYYGVTDLLKLHQTTHKFEAGYLYSLIGCTEDNIETVLPQRSPLFVSDKISAPVIFFQGDKDAVVPLEQAEMMSSALKERNIPTRLFIYEGEGHGFRKAETIISTLSEELAFYKKIFCF